MSVCRLRRIYTKRTSAYNYTHKMNLYYVMKTVFPKPEITISMPASRRPIVLGILNLIVFGTLLGTETGLRIMSLEPTVLFPKREPLAQVARLTVVNDTGSAMEVEAVVTIQGGAVEKIEKIPLAINQSTVEVLVPDISTESNVRVDLRREGKVLATHGRSWQPQRKWKVHVVKSSHEDIGYEHFIQIKQKEIADYIDLAREIARPRVIDASGAKTNVGYHYVMETILFARNYIEERGERAWRKLLKENVTSDGGLSLMAAPSGVHTHWMDYEELARIGYPARREMKDRFGLDLKTAFIVDNPSLSWSGMQALAASGIKYVGRWGQSWRSGGNNNYQRTKLPALFWWKAPDGDHRMLFAWTSTYPMMFWWGQTNGGYYGDLAGLPARWVNQHLQMIEDGGLRGPYPYDAMMIPDYSDHETPKFDERMYRLWRGTYAYPEIRFEHPEKFFTYIEKKYGAELPELSGDLNNFSADYSAIDPDAQGEKRRAARLLPAAEGLGVLAGIADPSFAHLPAEIERTYTRMFDFDEHSWPTLPQVSDEQLFNAAWVKRQEATRALRASTAAFDRAASALGPNLAGTGPGTIAVFNPLLHVRTDTVELKGTAVAVRDLRSGKLIPCERLEGGRIRFLAGDVPSYGYALFQLVDSANDPAAPAAELAMEPLAISNRYYTVRFHPENGAVTSIVDRASGRELIDRKAPYLANQLVYQHKNTREGQEGFEYSPAKALRMEPKLGANQVTFDAWFEDAKLGGRVRQTVTLHAGLKRVDFTNRLESIDVMWAREHADRYRDNIYYAFPFAVPGGQIRAEYPGGVVRPYDDQLRWGSHDFIYATRWIDVSNGQGGVTLASNEAGTFSLGELRYNQFANDYKPTKPWLFSYAWSNRMAGLLTLHPDDCNATLTYSLTHHDGAWNAGPAARHGWEAGSPLLAVPATGGTAARWQDKHGSFVSADAANVQLTVLKASGVAGRGWIARFVETAGRATEFEFDASALGTERAVLCDLVEEDGTPLAVRNGKVRVAINPYGFATVRLLAGEAPGAVGPLSARDVTDSTVQLSWPGAANRDAVYNVYRSDDPEAPPTAYTMVARVRGNAFADRGLHIATAYHYRVVAVSSANLQGPVSAPLVVTTAGKNTTPPHPLHEAGIVRRAPDTLFVYWRKNSEPDVARYRVFRGRTPDFGIDSREPDAVVEANAYFLQVFHDTGLQPDTTYYYRIQPVDWSNNVQAVSPLISAKTPKIKL